MPEEKTGGPRHTGNSHAGNKNWGARGPGPGMKQNIGIHMQNDAGIDISNLPGMKNWKRLV